MDSKEKILSQAKLLFAQKGYAGVSVRSLAKAVGVTPAALYHHFPDKKTLYLETVQFAFFNKAQAFSAVWQSEQPAIEKLRLFVESLAELLLADLDFHRLIQHELLEADDERMKLLAEDVFYEQFSELLQLFQELAPKLDAHLAAISVLGLICQQIEMQPLRRYLPGWQAEHEQAHVIANHAVSLLLNGIIQDHTIRER